MALQVVPAVVPHELRAWDVGPNYDLVKIMGNGSYGKVKIIPNTNALGLFISSLNDRHFVQVAEAISHGHGGPRIVGAGTRVAIKQVPNIFANQKEAKMMLREFYLLRRLRASPHIVSLLDAMTPAARGGGVWRDLYLVFEWAGAF